MNNVEYKLRIVEQELDKIPGPKRQMGDRMMICCPYHNDSSPSATISLDTSERRVPLGWMGCFACKKNVKWNDLATTLHLQKFGKNENLSSDDYADPEANHESFLGVVLGDQQSDEERFPDLKDYTLTEDFPFDSWRNVDVSLLKKVGAKLMTHDQYGTHYVFLPVMVDEVLQGYVRARLNKSEDGKPSYLNAKGGWSRKWGLLYYDYAVQLMRRNEWKTIVLCEGPRDSLRLLKHGIPAVSVLGAMNWGADKRRLLEQAEVEKVILFFDGDKAGWSAARFIYRDVKKFFNTKYVALWKLSSAWDPANRRFPSDKALKQLKIEGKLAGETDPFDCDLSYIQAVKKELE